MSYSRIRARGCSLTTRSATRYCEGICPQLAFGLPTEGYPLEDFWGLDHHANLVGSGWVGAAVPSGRLIDRILAQMYYSTYVRVKRKVGLVEANT